jgi:glycopeptide antibiotics resistance protein
MAVYALLALWFSGLYPRSRYHLIAIGLLLLGFVVEGAQGAMKLGRQPELYDLVANALGVLAGLTAALLGMGQWTTQVERLIPKE